MLNDLLLNHLETVFGISGTVLDLFRSYLTGHRQFVVLGEYRSDIGPVSTGIPQGSIVGPLLFSLYLFPLGQLLRTLYINYHFYANDIHIYIHCTLRSSFKCAIENKVNKLLNYYYKINYYYYYTVCSSVPASSTFQVVLDSSIEGQNRQNWCRHAVTSHFRRWRMNFD